MFSNLFPFLLAAAFAQQIPDRESVTFGEAPDFGAVRDCAVCCFERQLGCYYQNQITAVVGCSLNSCLCSRSDIRTIVTSYLQSCVSRSCSAVSGDVSVALSVFGGYCDRYIAAGVDAGATTTDGDRGGGGGVSPETVTETRTIPLSTLTTTLEIATVQVAATTITVTPDERLPGNQPSNTVTVTVGSSGGLSESAKIGLGVGLGIGIPIFAVSAFLAYRFTRALAAPPEMPPQPIQGSYIG
ncbi:hypothetical protein TWF506_002600 [Arthrobotrys conoides]|uniref:Extracellular membrane protein CFEM domain-containing protein n=1 Tax=Arthrobotrys conoides TaxID=74498 RepID=A0AAN8RJX7_9PEZI